MITAFQPDAFQIDVLAFQIGDGTIEVVPPPAVAPGFLHGKHLFSRTFSAMPQPGDPDDDDRLDGLL